MEAYIVAVIGGDQKSLIQKGCTYRVLDLSPDIINRVCDVPYERFIELLKSGITMPGITLSYGSVYYYNSNIMNCVPHLKSSRAVSKKVIALRQVYSADGDHEIILANCQGKLSKIPLCEVMQNDLTKYIVNIEFKRTEYTDKFPVVMSGDYYYKLLTPDGKLLQTIGLPNSSKIDINAPLDSNYKTGLKIFDEWIDKQYFDDVLSANNIGHSISAGSLRSIDGVVPVLNIPVGIGSVTQCAISTIGKTPNIKVIRIPNTVTYLENSCFAGVELPVKLIWQEREDGTVLGADGINGLIKNISDYNVSKLIPHNIKELTGLFNNTTYGSGDFSCLSKLEKLGFVCKSNSRLYDGISLPDSLKELQYSFQNCDLFNRDFDKYYDKPGVIESFDLDIPSRLEEIKNSFLNVNGIENIDFSNCSNLHKISDSFNNIPGVKKIDLSKCNNLAIISDSFKGLKDLEEVLLPEGLTFIGNDCFSDCPNLKNIILPESLLELGFDAFLNSGITELRIPASVTHCRGVRGISRIYSPRISLKSGNAQCSYVTSHDAIIFEGLKEIYSGALTKANMDDVTFPDDISKLEIGCFNSTSGKLLNMFNWVVEEIPDDSFEKSTIAQIILPSNLKSLGETALTGLDKLKKLFIPSGVSKLGKKNLSKIGSSLVGGTEYYVIEGSSVEKELIRSNKRVYSFSTDEDAINNMLGLTGTSSDRAQSKARMLLNSSDNPYIKEFASPKYIKDVQKLMDIYKEVTSETLNFSTENIKLNTSKMKIAINFDEMFSKLPKLRDDSKRFNNLIYNYTRIAKSFCDDSLNDILPKLTVQFKLLSNIITLASEPLKYITDSDSYIKMLDLFIQDINVRISYEDDYSIIFNYEADLMMNGIKNRVLFWEIMVGGRIVYLTAELIDYYEKNDKFYMPFEHVLKPHDIALDEYPKLSENKLTYRISKVISPGDYLQLRFASNMKLGGADIPPILQSDILTGLMNMIIPVGASSSTNNMKIAFLSMVDGTLMMCNSNPATCNEFTKPFNQSYLSVISVETYGNWSQDSIKLIRNTIIQDNGCNELIRQSMLGTNTVGELSNKKGAFDTLEACFEWNLSKALNEANIDTLERLNSKNIKLILDTKFFAQSRKKLEDLEYLETFKDIQLSDGSIIHIKYPNRRSSSMMIGYDVKFYSYLEIPGEPFANTVDCYSSSKSIVSIFGVIKSIYSSTAKSYGYLKEEFADPEDFKCIWEASLAYSDAKVGLAVNRSDGVIYAYSRIFNQAFLPMFRFKNSDDAMKFGSLLYKDAESYTSKNIKVPIREIVKEMASYTLKVYRAGFEDANKSKFDRMITDTRNYIMSGYPNDYIVQGDAGKLFKLCAKQPPNLEDIG